MTKGTGGDDNTGVGGDNGTAGDGSGGSANPTNAGGNAGSVNPVGQGGAAGMGQGGAAGMAMGGMAGVGMGGAGAGGMPNADIFSGKSTFGFSFKSSWMITGCQQKAQHDCITIPACPGGTLPDFENRGAVITETFPVGGDAGKTYAVTFTFNSIAEGKYYSAGTRDAGNNVPANINTAVLDTFHRGGSAVPGSYNVMRIRVLDAAKMEVGKYYMNSFPQASGAESHKTFKIGYTKTIDVIGGGSIEYQVADSNCHAIDNCNDGDVVGDTCNAARNMPNEDANAMLPPMYPSPKQFAMPLANVAIETMNSRTGNKQPWHSQVGHLTVTNVVAK